MVQVFKANKKANKKQKLPVQELHIDSLDLEGQGVVKGFPVTFVKGGLPGELCKVQIIKQSKRFQQGKVTRVVNSSDLRITPFCKHFEQCGGCQNQHIAPENLLPYKKDAVSALLERSAGVDAADIPWQPPLTASTKHYRRKARLAVDARNRDNIRLGFRAQSSKQILSIDECQILNANMEALLLPLQSLLQSMRNPSVIGHISMLNGENDLTLGFRVIKTLAQSDVELVEAFAEKYNVKCLLQHAEGTSESDNHYALSASNNDKEVVNLNIYLSQDDFVQVNSELNQAMVSQAVDWLTLSEVDRVLDLFCGVGNFSLPLALKSGSVLAIEGVAEMVQKAQANAQINGIENIEFLHGDLSADDCLARLRRENCNKVLLDPARDDALEVMEVLNSLRPEAILYVSCNPNTFVRDIAQLLQSHYALEKIGLLDMFPYTTHTEIMALFTLKTGANSRS